MKFSLKIVKRDYFLALLLLIFLLFSFFRFYNLDKRVIFDWDQERDAFAIKRILIEKRLTLIGPRVLGPEGFFLGPYFTYLLAPFYFLTRLHPKAMVFFLIVYNFGFFALTFLVLKKLFNHSIALIFLLIWSLHPGLIGIDTIVWNPILVSLVIIGVWYLVSQSQWFLTGILLGLGVNFHFQMIFLLPFYLSFLFFEGGKTVFKKLAVSFVGFLIPFLPLLVFDLRHNFLNFRLLSDFISKKGEAFNGLAWLPVWKNVAVGFIGKDTPFLLMAFYFLPLLIALYLLRRETEKFKQKFFLATIILWLVFPFGFTFFGQRPSEYYFNFLYPFLILLFAYFLLKIIKDWRLIFLLLLLFFFFRIDQLKAGLQPNSLGSFYKEKVVQRIDEIGQGKKFNVSFSVPLGLDTGYRYLLEFYQIKQSQDPDDPLFQIVIPPQKENELFGRIGLQVPHSFQQQDDGVE